MNYKSSIIGYHNPRKHLGLSPEEFLSEYVDALIGHAKQKGGWQKVKLAGWIKDNWESQLIFVSRLFPNTLTGIKQVGNAESDSEPALTKDAES